MASRFWAMSVASAAHVLAMRVESEARVLHRRNACALGASLALGTSAAFGVELTNEAKLTTFKDPLFELTYPADFFAIRRTISGDVVRRGGVIFTAGRLSTAEIVTVERFPVSELLAQADAVSFFPDGKLNKWRDLGTMEALATYLCERRDNEATIAARGKEPKARASQPIKGSVEVGGALFFRYNASPVQVTDDTLQADVVTVLGSTEMRVGDAGAKAMTSGVRRIQRAKIFLLPGGRTLIGCWAGCLDDLWNNGEGKILCDVVASFKPVLPAV